jgi:ADP-heptose:LPS heptosyltransferase
MTKNRLSSVSKFGFLPWFLLGALALPLVWLRKLLRPPRRRRMLVCPQRLIGDFVVQAPVFREAARNGTCTVDVLVFNAALKELIICDPSVNKIFVWDERSSRREKLRLLCRLILRRYDLNLNLNCQTWLDFTALFALIPVRVSLAPSNENPVTALIRSLFGTRFVHYPRGAYSTEFYVGLLRHFGIEPQSALRQLSICDTYREQALAFLDAHRLKGAKPLVGILCSCGNTFKKWPDGYFAVLADLLAERYSAHIVFFGAAEDSGTIRKVQEQMKQTSLNAAGMLSLGAFAALCEHIALYISVDSGTLYIAHAVGTPVVNIAGPVAISEQLRPSARDRIVQLDLPCIPCSFIDPCAHTCRFGHRDCIEKLSPQLVFEKAAEVLSHA